MSRFGELPKDLLKQPTRRGNEFSIQGGGEGRIFTRSQTIVIQSVPQLIIVENANRVYFLIQNNSVNNMWLSFGVEPTVGNSLKLLPNAVYEPFIAPTSTIYVIGEAVNLLGFIVESVRVQ